MGFLSVRSVSMLRRSPWSLGTPRSARSAATTGDEWPYTLRVPAPLPASTASTAVKTALLTLGRLPVALEIARALHAGGWRVIVAEPLRWHLCRTSRAVARCRTVTAPGVDPERYLDDLLGVVDEESVSLVVPVSEEVMFVAALHDRLPDGVALACPPRALLLDLHDKWRFVERARELGLAVPGTALASSEAGRRLAARGAHVLKPRLSCSGVGVRLRDGAASLADDERTDELVVQERLNGEPCCAAALAIDGRTVSLVAYRSLLEAGSVSVTFERIEMPAGVREFVERFVAESGCGGMVGFDFIADADGRWHAIECNPRATSGVHLMSPERLVEALVRTAGCDAPEAGTGSTPGTEPVPEPGAAAVGARRQEFWSALAETEGRFLRGLFTRRRVPRATREDWRRLFTTRDVDWSRRDPLPFLLMAFSGLPLVWRAIRARRPITEVTMSEMGWYDPERVLVERERPERRSPRRRSPRAAVIEAAVLAALVSAIRCTVEPTMPSDMPALVESVVFGTSGLRYRRLDVAAQMGRLHDPVFVCAYRGDALVGVYALDRRALSVDGRAVTGVYRGALCVASGAQGSGVGGALAVRGREWIDALADGVGEAVLSWGCVDADNTRSLTLLEREGAIGSGALAMVMSYRQWPRERVTLEALAPGRDPREVAVLAAAYADCPVRDVTWSTLPGLATIDPEGVRVSARVAPGGYRIETMGADARRGGTRVRHAVSAGASPLRRGRVPLRPLLGHRDTGRLRTGLAALRLDGARAARRALRDGVRRSGERAARAARRREAAGFRLPAGDDAVVDAVSGREARSAERLPAGRQDSARHDVAIRWRGGGRRAPGARTGGRLSVRRPGAASVTRPSRRTFLGSRQSSDSSARTAKPVSAAAPCRRCARAAPRPRALAPRLPRSLPRRRYRHRRAPSPRGAAATASTPRRSPPGAACARPRPRASRPPRAPTSANAQAFRSIAFR